MAGRGCRWALSMAISSTPTMYVCSKGRTFDARDKADTAPVVVIDQRMAQALWPDGDGLQQSLTLYPGRPTRVRRP